MFTDNKSLIRPDEKIDYDLLFDEQTYELTEMLTKEINEQILADILEKQKK